MIDPNADIRNFFDTARWVAYIRAMETRRADAVFCDPYAERLAGERGFQIGESLTRGNMQQWPWVARTYQFDTFISRLLRDGTDLVLNLAAGLDARPYRMELPSTLQWVEVDFPEIISYKEEILANDRPRCQLERVPLDLSDVPGRRALFSALNARANKIAVVSEGLLIYFTSEEVAALARELAADLVVIGPEAPLVAGLVGDHRLQRPRAQRIRVCRNRLPHKSEDAPRPAVGRE